MSPPKQEPRFEQAGPFFRVACPPRASSGLHYRHAPARELSSGTTTLRLQKDWAVW
ncbi:hypothetical protein IF2G_09633 [Cordyceps javanica]|nr:hypothetical protein IF2G_09633 [Cordyceps javanica]